mgnify:CR=1 FL=1
MMSTAILDEVPLPWQQQQWQRLRRQVDDNKLAHAYLFSGASGTGKLFFARRLALYLLCLAPSEGLPCGHCRNCQIGGQHQHPDVLIVEPAEEGRGLKIDQIRDLNAFTAKTSHAGRHKVVIIDQAHRMNNATANALLKTLEEPAGKTIIILTSDLPGFLSATIRSRCQRIQFPPPGLELADSWLKQHCSADLNTTALLAAANCRPLFALEIAETERVEERRAFMEQLGQLVAGDLNPELLVRKGLALGEQVANEYFLSSSAILIKCLVGRSFQSADCPGLGPLVDLVLAQNERLPLLRRLMQRYQDSVTANRQILSGANPNTQLMLESLSWRWSQLLKS